MVSVSICVPAYEAARTLEQTLRSILSQDADFELVVLDNASTDATGEIAASFDDPRIRVERNATTLAIGDNWNRAIALSTGELVKVVCADDILLPGALAAHAVGRRPRRPRHRHPDQAHGPGRGRPCRRPGR